MHAIRKTGPDIRKPETFKKKVITKEMSEFLADMINANPDVVAHKMAESLLERFHAKVSVSTINRHLRSQDMQNHVGTRFTVKQLDKHENARNDDETKRLRVEFVRKFFEETAKYQPIFIDETRFNQREYAVWGRAPLGQRAIKRRSSFVHTSLSAITAITYTNGVMPTASFWTRLQIRS